MAKRIIMQPNLVKVSRPGFDVDTAAEKDLLISLGSRTVQAIQRGYIAFGAPTGKNQFNGNYYVVNIAFPTQQSVPDGWIVLIEGGNNNTNAWFIPRNPISKTFTTSTCTFRIDMNGTDAYPTDGQTGISYIIFRKRLTG